MSFLNPSCHAESASSGVLGAEQIQEMFLFRLTLTQINGEFPGYRKNVWSKVIWIFTFYWWYLVLRGGGEESLSLYTYKP